MNKIIKHHLLPVLLIMILALTVRLYKITAPLGDWHSFRQADTASVAREFIKHHYPIWEAHYHDLSNIQSGQDNLSGYRMVEFPLVNYLVAQIINFQPSWDLVITYRLSSIGFSLLGIISLYGLVYLLTKRRAMAFLSAFIMSILPYSIFYSRVILPEPAMIGIQLLSLWTFIIWLQKKGKGLKKIFPYFISLIAFSLSLLIKPTAIFIAPVYLVLAFYYLGINAFFSIYLWFYVLLGVAPLLFWRTWIKNYPAGIPASAWLLNGNGIRLRPAWWKWLFGERIAKLILGSWGTFFLGLGLINKIKTSDEITNLFDLTTLAWVLGSFSYLVIFASGNVQHDYYQVLLIPIISILIARGIFWIIFTPTNIRKIIAYPIATLIFALSLFMSWMEIRGYYDTQHPAIVTAGMAVDKLTPQNSKIIAPYQGDTALLFQTNRTGWPIGFEIDDKISKGASYYISLNQDQETKTLMKQYEVIESNDQYTLINLTNKIIPNL